VFFLREKKNQKYNTDKLGQGCEVFELEIWEFPGI
jgi:hypothetical protein